jgi:hypothetical protein
MIMNMVTFKTALTLSLLGGKEWFEASKLILNVDKINFKTC